MHHDHEHTHQHYGRAFAIGALLNVGFVAIEFFYGIAAHSLALISDATHNLSDVGALLLAWGASVLVHRHATIRFTYGLRRVSILAALANAILLVLVTGGMAWEAIRRLITPETTDGITVIIVAAAGILVNGICAWLFHRENQNDLNVRAAFMHMAADTLVSAGVVVGGIAILITNWSWLDPIIGLIMSAVILIGTWQMLREAIDMALDAVPRNVDIARVRTYLEHLSGVGSIHDLHIWAMSTTETALTAHLVMADPSTDNAFLDNIAMSLHDQFGIEHVTIQREATDDEHQCQGCEVPAIESAPIHAEKFHQI